MSKPEGARIWCNDNYTSVTWGSREQCNATVLLDPDLAALKAACEAEGYERGRREALEEAIAKVKGIHAECRRDACVKVIRALGGKG